MSEGREGWLVSQGAWEGGSERPEGSEGSVVLEGRVV